MAHKDGRECPVGTKNHKQVPRDHLGPKEWVKSEPECHKCAVKWQYFLQIQSSFWAISTHYKGYQTAYEVLRMARGIPLIPKNHEKQVSVYYKSKYLDKMDQKLNKLVKNAV